MSGPRVALATCRAWPGLAPDEQALRGELAALGADVVAAVWDDPAVDWHRFDLVVVRSTWDYTERRESFLAWAAGVPRLANPAAVLAWNTDKRYLAALAAAGTPVPETAWWEPGQDPVLERGGVWVVKPMVGAGSADTGRYRLGDRRERAAAEELVRRLLGSGRAVMVQPYLPAVDEHGETALVFLDGRFSHAVRKGPMLDGPHRPGVDPHDFEQIEPRVPEAGERELAEGVLASLPLPGLELPAPLLYARVDLVPGGAGGPVLMELELTEPALYLGYAPGAAARFAAAILEQAC